MHDSPPAYTNRSASAAAPSAKARSKASVLVADDHDDTRLMLRTILEMKGFNVLEAADGMKAVMLMQRERPDLVLMDFGLPILDGLTALQIIRSNKKFSDLPIIFLSGRAEPEPKAAVSEAGCDDYLVKPIDLDKMLELIERRLDGRSKTDGRA
jgi:DNA-binding response OmpR family regulator